MRKYKYIVVSDYTLALMKELMQKNRIRTFDRFVKHLYKIDDIRINDVLKLLIRHRGKYVTLNYIINKMRTTQRHKGSIKARLQELTSMSLGCVECVKGIYYRYVSKQSKRVMIPVLAGTWYKLSINKIRFGFLSIDDVIMYLLIRNYDMLNSGVKEYSQVRPVEQVQMSSDNSEE